MIKEIYTKIWALSPYVDDPESYSGLTRLTRELIGQYEVQGRLRDDPFSPTRERTLSLPKEKIQKELKGSTCLVTGGLGCVGSALVRELLKYKVKNVIIIDIAAIAPTLTYKNIVTIQCDIRNSKSVHEVFAHYKPDFVFHTAAKRDPGLAELNIVETVSTNVKGTLNVIVACETVGSVKQLVFSSTGKASRYITEEIYAGTKKLVEFIFDACARSSKIRYSMTRCTHILDNSLMNQELVNASRNNKYVGIHSPGKYVTAQNALEAALLMLNALIYSQKEQCNFLLVRHLEWPVESLEMALYYIKESGRSIPVIFLGNPLGYSEKFFRGQFDWSRPNELNLLINVYEGKHRRLNEEEDIIIARPCTTDKFVLMKSLYRLEKTHGEKETRDVLLQELKNIVSASLKRVNPHDTRDILRWGLDTRFLKAENAQVSDFQLIVPLLQASLDHSVYSSDLIDVIYHHYAVN